MKKKSFLPIKILVATLAFSFSFAGCDLDPMPTLTEEEQAEVSEYAVGILMKYDSHHQNRLLSDKELETELTRLKTLADNKVNAEVYARQSKASKEKEREEKKQALDNTPTVDNATGVGTSAPVYAEEFLGLDGFTVRYTGYEVHPDAYPEAGEGMYFSVPAATGKDLLILNFDVANVSGSDQHLDMFGKNVAFLVTVNGDMTKFAEQSLLLNDLATYNDTIPAGQSETLVLIVQIDEDLSSNITSVGVSMQSESKIATTRLD
ncbi:MAG: hypothetical protein J5537_04575 [Lachnospiraceae bacterium]|nr:hypothetical protein [Lachnospiraceae bacterium]